MEPARLIAQFQFAREESRDIDEIAQTRHRLIKRGRDVMVPLLVAIEQQQLPDKLVREMLFEIAAVLDEDEKRHALSALRHHAVQGQQVSSRMVALEILTAHMEGALHEAQSLLPMAIDPRCPSLVRAQTLRALARSQLDSISLRSLLDLVSDPSEEIALSALDAVERHGAAIVPTAAVERLLRLLLSSKGVVRRRAIELLGTFGEVDLIERLCSLPVMEPADIDAIQRMVKRILTRPRSLLHISPHSFEHLISRMLAELQFVEVTVTGGVHDDGVDLTAVREESTDGLRKERRQYVIQCKRHRDNIGPRMVEEFISALKQRPSTHGLFIATSHFTPEARAAVGAYRLTLFDRDDLQKQLGLLFGEKQYYVPLG